MKSNIICWLLLCLFFTTCSAAEADINQKSAQKLLAEDGMLREFGYSVSLSADGSTGLIGDDSGEFYIFVRTENNTWRQVIKLAASDALRADDFGRKATLSADGRTVLIGGAVHQDKKGAAYVFTRMQDGMWHYAAKLDAADAVAKKGHYFDIHVSLSEDGSTALIGSLSGSAHIFTRDKDSWTQQANLPPANGNTESRFGKSLSLSADGSSALIGAEYDDRSRGGAAYIFTRDNGSWTQQAKLIPANSNAAARFGCSVSLSADGRTALIGAPNSGNNKGSAYVFIRSDGTWNQMANLTAFDGAGGHEFGWSLSLSADGKTALIGSGGSSASNGPASTYNYKGAAYIFTRSGNMWSLVNKLTASDSAPRDVFGGSVALSADGSTALIGAAYHDRKGAAYVFNSTPEPIR